MILRKNPSLFVFLSLVGFLSALGCSTFSRSNSDAEKAAQNDEKNRFSATEEEKNSEPSHLKDQKITHLESTVTSLNSRIAELEGKLQAAQTRPQTSTSSHFQSGPENERHFTGASVAATDPGIGFINDAAVRAFQQGKILFDQEKFPESILGFSAFLETNPKHALASSAQYYIGENYYRQGDYAVADQEFQKLTSRYPRSPRTSFALVRLSQSAGLLGKAEESKRYRVQVEGLFPKSPALLLFRESQNSQTPIATAPDLTIEKPSIPAIETPKIETPKVEVPTIHAPNARVSGEDLDAPPGGGG